MSAFWGTLESISPVIASMHYVVFDGLAQRFVNLVLDEVAALVGNHTENVVKAGDDQDTDHGAQQHPANCGTSNCAVADRPRSGGTDQWNQTGDEGERGHQNWPKS